MQSGCVICQDRFDAAVGIVTTKCGHVFHNKCIEQWLERSGTCPECRSKVCKTSLTKLYFNCSFDTTLDNSIQTSLDALKEQLHGKDLEIRVKDKKIEELRSYCAKAESNVEDLHQKNLEVHNAVDSLKRELRGKSILENKYRRLEHAFNSVQMELDDMHNVKAIVEGCADDTKKILADVQLHASNEDRKIALQRIATYCSVIKRELLRSKEEKTQLQNEVTQIKRKMGILQASSAQQIKQLQAEIKNTGQSPLSVTPSRPKNDDIHKSLTVCGPSHDGSPGSEKQITPISVDFPEKKKQKLNVVVLDKEVKKVTASAKPVLSALNAKIRKDMVRIARGEGCVAHIGRKVPSPEDEDSVSRVGYNGLGGHGCFFRPKRVASVHKLKRLQHRK